MKTAGWLLGCFLLGRGAALAQAPVGDGLRGDYYQGLGFDRAGGHRLDAQLNFDWQGHSPLPGLPADYFTVRWTGWLQPPVTGRYVLRLTVDDAVRLWLDGKVLLDEWRGQPLGYYEATVNLQAGRAYRLRLDYGQYSRAARLQLAWERPRRPEAPGSWRNLWNLRPRLQATNRLREIIPTRYLFSHLSAPPQVPPAAGPRPVPPAPIALARVVMQSPKQLALRSRAVASSRRVASHAPPSLLPLARPRLVSPPLLRPTPSLPGPRPAATLATQLARGQEVTLKFLYFEQGQATLPPPVQASLDTLAEALARHPTLRLEVQGHTDNQGDTALNRQLSRQRAAAVCQYLAAHGVAVGRLCPVGLGGTHPVADNARPTERPRNRRVVLRPLP